MAMPEHTKIINKTARKIFKEYGIIRKGQSRTWLDDNGWFTTLIEFQPSNYSKGTYLNIGVCFHWHVDDYWSFNIGYREAAYCEYKNEKQFTPVVTKYIQQALAKVLLYRDQLSDLESAERTIFTYDGYSSFVWACYHKAVILGLNNKVQDAEHYFNLILAEKDYLEEYNSPITWILELKDEVKLLKSALHKPNEFKNAINKIIVTSRKLKKLKEIEINSMW